MAKINLKGVEPDYSAGMYYVNQQKRLSTPFRLKQLCEFLGCHVEYDRSEFGIDIVKGKKILFHHRSRRQILHWLGIEALRRIIDKPRSMHKAIKTGKQRKKANR